MAPQPDDGGWRLLPLRLMIGFGFVAHGYAKLARGPDAFATILTSLGVPQPELMAWVTTLLEHAVNQHPRGTGLGVYIIDIAEIF